MAGLLIAHWMIRHLMFQAAVKAAAAPLRISFAATLKILRCRLPEAGKTAPEIGTWWEALVAEVADEVLEPRRRRVNPRVMKRTTFDFPKKRPRHCGSNFSKNLLSFVERYWVKRQHRPGSPVVLRYAEEN